MYVLQHSLHQNVGEKIEDAKQLKSIAQVSNAGNQLVMTSCCSWLQSYRRERKHWCPSHWQTFVCLKGFWWNVKTKIRLFVQLSRLSPLSSHFNVSYFSFDWCAICSLHAVCTVCLYHASQWLWVRYLHSFVWIWASVCVCSLMCGCVVSSQFASSSPREPICVRLLKVASGCRAFKHMLAHADRQAGRQACMCENPASTLLQVCVSASWECFTPVVWIYIYVMFHSFTFWCWTL